jgi:3-hydroxyacyl-CoA dehydrogenase
MDKEKTVNSKKFGLVALIVAILIAAVSAVSAQENTPLVRPGVGAVRELLQIVADETGLDQQEIRRQLREGMTLADIITTNGGNVNTVIDAAVTAAAERINEMVANGRLAQERADTLLANLEATITQGINGELRLGNGERPPRERARLALAGHLMDAVSEATGLDNATILPQAREGSTLAQIVEANGGNVDAVIDAAVASATQEINTLVSENKLTQERADALIGTLETTYTNMVNNSLPQRPGRGQPLARIVGRGVLQLAAEQTGLEVRAIAEQIRGGSSLADILTTNGVDVNTFIDDVVAQADTKLDEAVQNGRVTQEQADERIAQLRERLTERIHTEPSAGIDA